MSTRVHEYTSLAQSVQRSAREVYHSPCLISFSLLRLCCPHSIMKARKTLKHQQLIQEVVTHVQGRFQPKVADIKKVRAPFFYIQCAACRTPSLCGSSHWSYYFAASVAGYRPADRQGISGTCGRAEGHVSVFNGFTQITFGGCAGSALQILFKFYLTAVFLPSCAGTRT